ncbi:MAG: hypothetical protein Solivirus4_8 [Solivirus sp.]|uniref:Uncharacterized protein n=1 Tax=Solivirus sp. TaxID=2487772 RepID=A0A3G5AFU5_9VIRU|nr:MAG: hypothetical protein Solivirus4_8 [Solivirus sp.]
MFPIGVGIIGERETIEICQDREYGYKELMLFDNNSFTNCSFPSLEKITIVKTRAGSYSPFSNCKFTSSLNLHVISKEESTIFLNDIHIQNLSSAFIGSSKVYLAGSFFLTDNYTKPFDRAVWMAIGDEVLPVIESTAKKFILDPKFFEVFVEPVNYPERFLTPFEIKITCCLIKNPEIKYRLGKVRFENMHVIEDPLTLALIEQRGKYEFVYKGDVWANWSASVPDVILNIMESFDKITIEGDIQEIGLRKAALTCGNLVVKGNIGKEAFNPDSCFIHIYAYSLSEYALSDLHFSEEKSNSISVNGRANHHSFDRTTGFISDLIIGNLRCGFPNELIIDKLSFQEYNVMLTVEEATDWKGIEANIVSIPKSSLCTNIESAIKIIIDKIDKKTIIIPDDTLIVEIKNFDPSIETKILQRGCSSLLDRPYYFSFLNKIEMTNEQLDEFLEEFKVYLPEGSKFLIRELMNRLCAISIQIEDLQYVLGSVKITSESLRSRLEESLPVALPYLFSFTVVSWLFLIYLSIKI